MQPSEVRATIARYLLADGMDLVLDLDKSHGSWIYDSSRKREYLDLFSCFASLPIGYNHPRMREQQEYLGRVAVNKPSNSDVYTVEMAEFVKVFSEVAIPAYLPHAFFISGGALAVENALKAAFDWKVRKNLQKGYREEKGYKVIHFRQAFHGRSGYTLSLTNTADPNKTKYFPKFDWPRVTNPRVKFPLEGKNLEEVIQLEEQALQEIREVLQREADDIAALIIEPIQGEGGDNHFRDQFFRELRALADEYDFIFIMDEVQTGIGLTGRMWAHQHFSVKPDMISFGKKTQVCGFLSSRRIDEIKENVFTVSSRINSTEGGNLVDMVRFRFILEIIRDEKLVENAASVGEYLLGNLLQLQEELGGFITNARGRGLMVAFDLPSTKLRDLAIKKIFELGAVILPSGTHSIRFRPVLNFSKEEVDIALDIISRALKDIR